MNSNTENRKSMDDVLASIRRIVRAEKEPDAEPARNAGGGEAEDAPLALTPDMRTDGGTVEPEAISRPAERVRQPVPTDEADAMPDSEALRRMVRQALLDELAGGEADDAIRGIIRDELMNGEIGNNISQNVMRLIQAEVAKALENR